MNKTASTCLIPSLRACVRKSGVVSISKQISSVSIYMDERVLWFFGLLRKSGG